MLYPRDIMKEIGKTLEKPEILILLGSRQVGKTTVLTMIRQALPPGKTIFLDLDLETNLDYFSSYENILSYLEFQGLNPGEDRIYLFLDEFQRVTKAGKTLKNLYDHNRNIKIIATGSSSLEINKTISESMAGRKQLFRVYPLNFREFLVFKGNERLIGAYDRYEPGEVFSNLAAKKFEPYFIEKLIFGSFPAVVLEADLERKGAKISEILNSYLRRDIREQLGVKDTVLYKKVLELAGVYMANLLNVNAMAMDLGAYYRKIKNILEIAAETYLIDEVRPYFVNRKNEIVRNTKVYFEDAGMRNFLIRNMNMDIHLRPDMGALVENFVYNEMLGHKDVFTEIKFWRSKNASEIDFLLIRNQKILPVEVKSGNHENIPATLLNFCLKKGLNRAVIVNKGVSKMLRKEKIKFYFIPFLFSAKIADLLE